MSDTYAFAVDVLREDGSAVRRIPVLPDWEPALEHARFAAVRGGGDPIVTPTLHGVVEPVWHDALGAPYISGVAVVPAGAGGERRILSTGYFGDLTRALCTRLVEEGVVAAGVPLYFLIRATPATESAPATPAADPRDFVVEEIPQRLPLIESSLARHLAGAVQRAAVAEDDVPVFVPAATLDEAMARTDAAGEVETGGLLVGHLHQDRTVPEVFVEITAQLPAEHTVADATRLTFSADTWAAARSAVARRGRGELFVGWWHSHPADPCRACPQERREHCTLTSTFFSVEDVHLHRVCFSAAYTVALLISRTATGLVPTLFGWRGGVIAARSYHLTGTPSPAPAPPMKGASHAQSST